jgi:ABC-type transport system involved in multi-copper enzyme maturation permease subunit
LNATQVATFSSLGALNENKTIWHYAFNSGSNNVMLFLSLFAIMTLAGEYNSGTIQITQLAISNRNILFASKAVFIGLLSFLLSCLMSLLDLLVALIAYNPHDGGIYSEAPEMVQEIFNHKLTINPAQAFLEAWQLELLVRPFTITLIVLIAFSCAFIVKNLIGSLFTFLGVYSFAPAVMLLFYYITKLYKSDENLTMIQYLPSSLVGSAYGSGIVNTIASFGLTAKKTTETSSIIALIVWTVVFLVIAYVTFIKSDSSSK